MKSARFCLLLLCCLSLISCSGSAPASSTNSMTLRVAQNSTALDYFPLYVAEQERFFKDQGVTLLPDPPLIMGQANKTTAAFEAGSIDVAAGTITDAFTVSRIDSSLKIIGTLSGAFTGYVIASKRIEAQTHLTPASPLAEKVKALVGKKIGVPVLGSAMEALLIVLLKKFGYREQEVTLVNLGASNSLTALGALSTGRVDAVAFPVPTGEEAQTQDIGDIFISPLAGEIPEMIGQLNTVIYTKEQIITTKLQAIRAFIRALAQADTFLHTHPVQARALLAKYLRVDQKTLAIVSSTLLPLFPQSPQILRKGYDEAGQFHVKAGLIAIAPGYQEMVAEQTIDQALQK